MSLRLDWCSHEAAKYAVEKWHYSRTMPVGKMVKIGVWEDSKFIGAVVFAQGNNQYQGRALADPEQGHVGGIYQAAGWSYVGTGGSDEAFFLKSGKRVHSRNVSKSGMKEHFGSVTPSLRSADLVRVKLPKKFKYLLGLDAEMRKLIQSLAKPYPKRVRSETIDTPSVQDGEGGETPTLTLHAS